MSGNFFNTEDPAQTPQTILLTGLNGYIASHIAHLLLSRGHTVIGTSRSASTLSNFLSQTAFAPFANTGRLQHFLVSDITATHAFDEAVKPVDGIIHTASPVDFTLTSVNAFFAPAVGGVTSILQSAYSENLRRQKHEPNRTPIHSFVLLSSIAAVVDRWKHPPISAGGTENRAYTESDWNVMGEGVARASEKAASEGTGPFLAMVAYGGSKAAAERAMWDSVPENANSGLACTSINPGVVTGPPLNWPTTPAKLNETLLPVWSIWSGTCKAENTVLPPQIGGATFIDVRDVAALHVWAIENPAQASGQRYLMTNGKAPPQAIADLLRSREFYPTGEEGHKEWEKAKERIIMGIPGDGYVRDKVNGGRFGWPEDEPTAKADKALQTLGWSEKGRQFIGYEESIRDTITGFRERWPELGL